MDIEHALERTQFGCAKSGAEITRPRKAAESGRLSD